MPASTFAASLRTLVVPALTDAGFAFDGSRTFRRLPAGTSCAQIVNFQLGERFLEGRFTVNLAVYDPEAATVRLEPTEAFEHHCAARHRQRLGLLLPRRLGTLARLPMIGLLFRPRDTWWRASDPGAIEKARDAIVAHGLAWLESHTPTKPPER
jgi:hypothetical protein